MAPSATPQEILGFLVMLVLLFLLVRKFLWWYWGIGRMIDAMESIEKCLLSAPWMRVYDQKAVKQSGRAA